MNQFAKAFALERLDYQKSKGYQVCFIRHMHLLIHIGWLSHTFHRVQKLLHTYTDFTGIVKLYESLVFCSMWTTVQTLLLTLAAHFLSRSGICQLPMIFLIIIYSLQFATMKMVTLNHAQYLILSCWGYQWSSLLKKQPRYLP